LFSRLAVEMFPTTSAIGSVITHDQILIAFGPPI